MNDDTTTRFIASLVKSLQSLCHGYVEFEKNIEIIGHIYLNIDSQQKYDYVVNEQVCKNDDESQAMFVSNSFHAQPPRTTVKTARQCNALDLKIQSAKDNIGIDLSTFQTDVGQGRSASRESSQSLSAGSETGSVSGNVPNREPGASPSLHCQNPERSVSRRKRHLHDLSSKPSPDVSPSSRIRDGERRDHHDNTSLRSQYTLGASASKLARRISNELEKQGLATPAQIDIDGEIHARLSASNETRFGRNGQGASQRQFSDDSSKHIDSTKDPPEKSEGQSFADSIDLSRVKEEVIEDESLFDQLDWNRTTRDTDQETYDPQAEGHEASEDQIVAENLAAAASSSLYPVMIHQNTAGLPMPGYGSPVFPQNFSEPTHTMSASSSPIASTSGQLSPGAVFGGRRTQPGNSGRDFLESSIEMGGMETKVSMEMRNLCTETMETTFPNIESCVPNLEPAVAETSMWNMDMASDSGTILPSDFNSTSFNTVSKSKSFNPQYECPRCHRRYSTPQTVKRHMKSHDHEYVCRKCTLYYKTAEELEAHQVMKHPKKSLRCPYRNCNETFWAAIQLNRHVAGHGSEAVIDCNRCWLTFTSLEDYSQHTSQCHP
ncbi:zinc finger and BTB domain-containing protein 20-like isoform X3 [Haliotis rubra]|uniref:zinc finger and BTB domain-containing protein 20-like isoform X3 n=1 Tax=Haliotis rubra TaxID=36100 RepID=UPI001EE595F7|nr:zinc finger and BTB domain-containing protein 20-like isoform X3 [Haliotis rubra]